MLPDFQIIRPDTLSHACQLLAEYDGEAVAYAGGTELLLAMKLGFADYPVLLDLKHLPELAGVVITGDAVRIGAAVTHRYLERSTVLVPVLPSLPAMASRIANPRVRASGTIGGNIAFGEPHSDPATYLVAVEAQLEIQDAAGGLRTTPVAGFLTGPFETTLSGDELLVAVTIPRPPPGTSIAHQRLVLTERPAVLATAAVTVADGHLTRVRLAVGSATPVPTRVRPVEELLTGVAVAQLPELLPTVAALTAENVALAAGPGDAYRRGQLANLVRRALADATSRFVAPTVSV